MTMVETARMNGLNRLHGHKMSRRDKVLPWTRAPRSAPRAGTA